jgi:hypothetical protein
MAVQNPKNEQISFIPADPTIQPVELLINPETLTLTWKKVITRRRTKTRLVTFFWGEEPVKFTYRGQTGYAYPSPSNVTGSVSASSTALLSQTYALNSEIGQLQREIDQGGAGGYKYVTADGNRNALASVNTQLGGVSQALAANTTIYDNLGSLFTNTQILYFSDKFKILKNLEVLYRKYQTPSDTLMKLVYRDYIFKGYFESFSYTDDAKNPWNWIYTIDFTILDWTEYPTATITANGEVVFPGSQNVMLETIKSAVNLLTIDQPPTQ